MKYSQLLLFALLTTPSLYAQDLRCFTSGPDKNTTTISALTACGRQFSGSVNSALSHTDSYSCVSGNNWIGGESIFYFHDVVEGRYTFKVKGFATDLDLFILSGCDESTCLSNQGARGRSGRDESVTLDLADGQNVYIVIDGKFVSSASFWLEIHCEGGVCDDLNSISCGDVKRHANYGSYSTDVINSHPSCGAGSYPQPEVGYLLNTNSSPITVDLVPENRIDLDLFVYDDCSGKLSNCLGASHNSPWGESVYLASGVNSGDGYILVDGKSQSGSYQLAVTCGEPCDQRPTKIGCNTVIHSTTKGKSNNASYYGCDSYHNKGQNWGPEVVYEIQIDDTYEINISLGIKGSADLNLYLLQSNCDPTSCIERSKREQNGGKEEIIERLRKGKYYIVVEGYRGASADFTLSVSGCGCQIKDELKCGEPIKGSLKNGTNSVTSINGECFIKTVKLPSEDVTYSFLANEDGHYSFMLSGMDGSMELFITEDCAGPSGCLGFSTKSGFVTDIVNLDLKKGQQVFALIDGFIDGKNSDFLLEVRCIDEKPDPDDKEEPEEVENALSCGESYYGSTRNKNSIFSWSNYNCFRSSLDFRGSDEIVKFEKLNDSDVLVAHMFHGEKSLENLSMFIMDSTFNEVPNCKGKNFRKNKTIGNGGVIGEFFTDEENPLPAGTYFAVLDGYNTRVASDFVFTTSCSLLDCESIVGLPCGESLLPESTGNGSNGESIYRSDNETFVGYTGAEKIYSFCLDSTTSVDINLYGIKALEGYSGDLDLFLMENVCSDAKRVIASSRNEGTEDETIKAELKAGEYYVVVDGWNDAKATFSIRNENCYASTCGKSKKAITKSKKSQSELKLYPNPFSEKVFLNYSSTTSESIHLSVFDPSGKRIFTGKWNGGASDISSLFPTGAKGTFFIQILDGDQMFTRHIIKI